jgi:hypothetical protein
MYNRSGSPTGESAGSWSGVARIHESEPTATRVTAATTITMTVPSRRRRR